MGEFANEAITPILTFPHRGGRDTGKTKTPQTPAQFPFPFPCAGAKIADYRRCPGGALMAEKATFYWWPR